jgi:hypothetical protein
VRPALAFVLALAAGEAVALPSAHLAFRRPRAEIVASSGVAPMADALAASQLAIWQGDVDGALAKARGANPEWDLMHRTFFAIALANLAEREPTRRAAYVPVVDRILTDTRAAVATNGATTFLLPYAHARPWIDPEQRSLFVEAELALLLGARLAMAPDGALESELAHRSRAIVRGMRAAPVLSMESYPDECWTFDQASALAALALAGHVLGAPVEGADALAADWIATARARLVGADTGLLVSSFRRDGSPLDGPEGSTIFLAAHALAVVDEPFARDQWRRAKEALTFRVLGFGLAREWPRGSKRAFADVDSGPIVPGLDASAGASGWAIVGAATFGDEALLSDLVASLELAAFPEREGGRLRYLASNAVGDAVLLYGLAQGPLWARVRAGRGRAS